MLFSCLLLYVLLQEASNKITWILYERLIVANKENTVIGKDLIESAMFTQAAGVFACTLGLLCYIGTESGTLNFKTNGLVPLLYLAWPILGGVVTIFISVIIIQAANIKFKPRAALLYIFIVFIIVDIFMLASLVKKTGGPHNSILTPVFLLIPAICAFYCNPRKLFFWGSIALIVVLFVLLSIDKLPLPFSKPILFQVKNQPDPSIDAIVDIFSTAFSIGCVCTAALGHFWINRIRKDHCELDHCGILYL